MDKSSHYIKMCESAKVIRKQWVQLMMGVSGYARENKRYCAYS